MIERIPQSNRNFESTSLIEVKGHFHQNIKEDLISCLNVSLSASASLQVKDENVPSAKSSSVSVWVTFLMHFRWVYDLRSDELTCPSSQQSLLLWCVVSLLNTCGLFSCSIRNDKDRVSEKCAFVSLSSGHLLYIKRLLIKLWRYRENIFVKCELRIKV